MKLAYYYKLGPMQYGWRPRLTLRVESDGRLSAYNLMRVIQEGWIFVGVYEMGKEPTDLWKDAHV